MSVLQELTAAQKAIDMWYHQSSAMLESNHEAFLRQLQMIERMITGEPLDATPSSSYSLLQEVRLAQTPSGRAGLAAAGDDSMASFMLAQGKELNFSLGDEEDLSGMEHTEPAEPDSHWLMVQFKTRKLLYGSAFGLQVMDYVIVGGDRGEDIGLVTEVFSDRDLVPKDFKDGPGKALRRATPAEVQLLLSDQRDAESEAVTWAQAAASKQGLEMMIVDAEYQLDRRKLTFYYESTFRPDFRSLVRELYQKFHARIWMEKAKG